MNEVEQKRITKAFNQYLFIEERFGDGSWDEKIYRAKRNLIKYLYSTWMCVGWRYTKEMHAFIKEI